MAIEAPPTDSGGRLGAIPWPTARQTRGSDNSPATGHRPQIVALVIVEAETEVETAAELVVGTVEAGRVREPAIEAETAGEAVVARWEIAALLQARAAVALSVVPQTAAPARARAVPEVAQAWVAHGAAAVEGGGDAMTKEGLAMSKTNYARNIRRSFVVVLAAMAMLLPSSSFAKPRTAMAQKTFPTAQAAADALIQAAGTYDLPVLEQILGPDSEDILKSEDPVRDKNTTSEFVEKAREKMQVSVDPKNPNRATVIVGEDDWPLPIPIVKKGTEWSFDTAAGREEMLLRRIGSNELDAIEICRGYVDAQFEYALEKHDNAEVNQYAQKIISSPGKHDGLVWYNADGSLGGPISEGIAEALNEGYTDKSKPYHGYYFKILKGQGPAAPLGAMDFVVEGAMIGGFALAAAPAEYRVTGVKTFIVSYQGIVYQKDLGPDSLKIFSQMEIYNPDKTWTPTYDNW